MDKGEIRHVEEYDAAVCRAKTVALDAASLASTKDFMVLHLDEELVRYCAIDQVTQPNSDLSA